MMQPRLRWRWRERPAEADTYWLATLDEVGKAVAFMASDGAGPMTATFAKITCGAVLD
jgi:hypothetical protein